VVVTHDAVEAMVLTDSLVVLEGGRIVQSGPPAEVARYPRTEYVASLLGLNLYRGAARGDRVELTGGGELVVAEHATGEVHVAVRPSAVALHRDRPEHSSPRNVWAGRIAGVEAVGDRVRVALTGPPDVLADVTTDAVADLELATGAEIWVSVKATEITVYPV
jgi:molybdate transport system ATP-binding protein